MGGGSDYPSCHEECNVLGVKRKEDNYLRGIVDMGR
jgi:hypothetical protein